VNVRLRGDDAVHEVMVKIAEAGKTCCDRLFWFREHVLRGPWNNLENATEEPVNCVQCIAEQSRWR
jgi:hypothetical protein